LSVVKYYISGTSLILNSRGPAIPPTCPDSGSSLTGIVATPVVSVYP
jgi:hypothetical protein